jgi:hypothetical protein
MGGRMGTVMICLGGFYGKKEDMTQRETVILRDWETWEKEWEWVCKWIARRDGWHGCVGG